MIDPEGKILSGFGPFMGRKIAKGKGTNGKLLRHVGMNIFFAGTVTQTKKKMNELN